MKLLFSLFLLTLSFEIKAQELTQKQFRDDLDYFLTTIEANYSYWDKKQTDWGKVRQLYIPALDSITNKTAFITLLERIFYELYDHHASLNTNTPASQRLVPSGTDIWAEYINGKPVITQLRTGSGVYQAGFRPGMEIIKFNAVPIVEAVLPFTPRSLKKTDIQAKNFALRMLLAGAHNGARIITVRDKDKEIVIDAGKPMKNSYDFPVSDSLLKNNIGYIRFNDRLWDNQTIPVFDSILQKYKNTSALIMDLRETPSGGNTTVARAILGSFISKEGFYQKHEYSAEEKEFGIKRSWMEIVSPRKYVYTKPLVILVDHWTGSVGEGIAIGFDGLKRATIIGTEMAGLNGANYSFTMPNSRIGFSFPSEKLFHVNGKPRESFQPRIKVDMRKADAGKDIILMEAMRFLGVK